MDHPELYNNDLRLFLEVINKKFGIFLDKKS